MTYWLALFFPPLAVMDAGRRVEACVSAVLFTPVVWFWLCLAFGGWWGLTSLPLAVPFWILTTAHAVLVLVAEGRKNRLTESQAVAREQEPCQVPQEKVRSGEIKSLDSAAGKFGPDERGVWVID